MKKCFCRILIFLFIIGCGTTRMKKEVIMPDSESTTEFAMYREGSQDATQAIQKALNLAAQKGGEVFLPPGRYRLDGGVTVPSGVILKGSWQGPHHARLKTGTVLLAYGGQGNEEGTPLISLEASSSVQGLTIYYPEQNIDDVKPYPWAIQGRGMHASVMDITLVNPYKGVDFGTHHNELHYLRNIFGCPLKIGVYVNLCTDIGRIENVHFNPHYWFRDEGDGEPRPDPGKLFHYLITEGEGFVFGRTDWEYVLNTFCYGYRIGYRFIATKDGMCNGNFLGIGADGTCHAVMVEESYPYGILITNGEFVSMNADDPVQIVLGPQNTGVVQFQNCAFWGPSNQNVRIQGGKASFHQCNFHYWDREHKGLPSIEATGGSVIVQNCFFHQPFQHIRLGPDVNSAIITGNMMQGKIAIENNCKNQVEINANASMK